MSTRAACRQSPMDDAGNVRTGYSDLTDMTPIRTALAGVVMATAGLLLTGCGHQPAATPATEATQVTPDNVVDVAFLRTVRNPQKPGLAYSSDTQLIAAAHNMCTNFAGGSTARQILATSNGPTPDTLEWVMGVGVVSYCPQYEARVFGTF